MKFSKQHVLALRDCPGSGYITLQGRLESSLPRSNPHCFSLTNMPKDFRAAIATLMHNAYEAGRSDRSLEVRSALNTLGIRA